MKTTEEIVNEIMEYCEIDGPRRKEMAATITDFLINQRMDQTAHFIKIKNDLIKEYEKKKKDLAETSVAMSEHCAEIESELQCLRKEKEMLVARNEALYVRIRERSNSDRGVTPKKAHCGYLILGSSQKDERIYFGYDYPAQTVETWVTTIQTPYPTTLDFSTVSDKVTEDIIKGLAKLLGCYSINLAGIQAVFKDKEHCVLYKVSYNSNCKQGYWEVKLYTTKAIKINETLLKTES